MAEGVSGGDFVKIEFTGTRVATGRVFDTSVEAKAKEAGIFSPRARYGPKLVVVGKGMVVKGFDSALAGMQVGQEKRFEVEPEQAYGLRSPSLVRVLPLSEFRKHDMDPRPGMMFEMDGAPAVVRSVTSGRVTVDLNHPLAGDKLSFEVKVLEKVSGTDAKAAALLDDSGVHGAAAKASGSRLEVSMPKLSKPQEAEVFVAKCSFIRAAKELLPEISEIEFREGYELRGSEPKKE
jgi:FKBP-type peptidyl-prolyl cis-trans isomerase 2